MTGSRLLLLTCLWALYKWWSARKRRERLRQSAVLEGMTAKGFEQVREACLRNIANDRESGVQLCCFHNGEEVVNISGGNSAAERLFDESLMVVFSSTKVMESLVIAMLVDRGHVKYEDSLRKIWPELRVDDRVTVGDLMRHQAGLLTSTVCIDSFKKEPAQLAALLAEQEPVWNSYDESGRTRAMTPQLVRDGFGEVEINPNTSRRQAYHALSRGWYSSEVCRRVDPKKRPMEQLFEEEIAAPMRAEKQAYGDFYIGCPPSQQHRCAQASADGIPHIIVKALAHLTCPDWLLTLVYGRFEKLYYYELETIRKIQTEIVQKSLFSCQGLPTGAKNMANDSSFRAIPMASVTGCGTARSMAAILSRVACAGSGSGDDIISEEGLLQALKTGETLIDEALGRPVTYTNCGWASDRYAFAGAKGWYGWGGAGKPM